MTTVVNARSREETDLALVLSTLQEQQKTGTLKLVGSDGRVKYVYFKRGTVELLKTNRSRTLIGKALLKRHKLTQEQLTAALERQKAAQNNLRLGEILVGMAIVKESDVHQALAYQIAEEIFELFTWQNIESEFFRGEPPLDIFESEDLQARVSLSPIQLAREAIRRQNELQEIRRTLPSVKDVFTLSQRAYRPENEQNPAIKEVLGCVDGKRSIEELMDVVRAPDLVALRVLVKLVHEGDIVPLSAQELLELGMELEELNQFAQARARYLRAEDLGHPDFDLPRRIGQIAEALGEIEESCRRYFIYADRCDQAGYPDVAVATLQRVLELDPDQAKARERYAELLLKSAKAQQEAGDPAGQGTAKIAAAQYEQILQTATSLEDQRRILGELVQLLPERDDLRQQMAELSISAGDTAQAVIDLQELAMNALEANNLDRAVGILEKILSIDPGDIMTVQSLASTYAKLGRTQDAVRQYLSFASSLEESGLAAASADTLIDIYEKIVELDPENTKARGFLATAYEGKENAAKAIKNYTRMVESLRKQGDEKQLLAALEKLNELNPSDLNVALERASLAKTHGSPEESQRVLRSVAESAQLQGQGETAAKAWQELLTLSPGDLEGHLALAKLQNQNKDHAAAAKRCAAVFELAMLGGAEDMAYEAVKQALDIEPDNPQHRERLARIQARRGQSEEAAKTLVRAARRARDDEDLGISRSWARRALKLDEGCDDAKDLLENLRRSRLSESPADMHRGPTVKATITGGSSAAPSIQGIKTKTKKLGGIADRLRSMKLGGPSAPRIDAGEEQVISRKASSAMNKLRAMKSGKSSETRGALPDKKKVSKGPEAPGEAADTVVSKKASSALNKLRAMRGGGGGGGGGGGAAEKKVSKGPEAPGEAADVQTSKKASSALNKLRAMRGGGGGGGGGATSEKKASKGPEAPGTAADAQTSKKASSALNKLRALRSGGGGGGGGASSEKKASKGPEAPGEAADQKTSQKASSAMDRLKALRGGGGGGGSSEKKASKGPEAPGEAADPQVSKKAGSALDRLKALRSGGGATRGQTKSDKSVSKGPEAPGEAADAEVSKKASSAMDRLRALRGGGG